MVSSPTTEVPRKEEKKAEMVTEVAQPTARPDLEGVFDDENYKLKTDESEWKMIADDDGVKTYEKKKNTSGLVAFRGEILIQAPLKKVASVMVDEALQKDWVASYVESRIVTNISEYEHVEYNHTKVPWPFQDRDFVFHVSAKLHSQPPTMLIMMKSVEDPAAPPISGIVRGHIVHSYYYLKELPSNRFTRMVVEMEVDPKGAIPLWLVNLSQKGWPQNTLAAVRRLALREDIPVLAKLEKYFEEKKPPKIAVKDKKEKSK